jgi:transcriptional regulator with XRE-family HTH domain
VRVEARRESAARRKPWTKLCAAPVVAQRTYAPFLRYFGTTMRDRGGWRALRATRRGSEEGVGLGHDAATPFDAEQICARIDELRTVLGLSWAELEARSGVSEENIRRWQSGESIPRMYRVSDVAEAMGSVYEEITYGLRRRREAAETPATGFPAYDPRRSAVGGAFVGRRATMQSLAAAGEQRRSVNVVGDRRIGKSSVVETWGQRARARGGVVAAVSGDRCETARSLVSAVTWAPAPNDPLGAAAALVAWARAQPRSGPPPLIVIDDLDRLSRRDDRCLYPLRDLMRDAALTLVVSTRAPLNERSPSGYVSPLAGMFVTERLGLLEADAVDALIGSHPEALAEEDAELTPRLVRPPPVLPQAPRPPPRGCPARARRGRPRRRALSRRGRPGALQAVAQPVAEPPRQGRAGGAPWPRSRRRGAGDGDPGLAIPRAPHGGGRAIRQGVDVVAERGPRRA